MFGNRCQVVRQEQESFVLFGNCSVESRCGRYCDECVAPMVSMVTEPRRAAAIQEAVAEYRRVTKQDEAPPRKCPDCGGPCQPRKRFCPKCALKRRRAAYKKADRARRAPAGMSCQQLSSENDEKAQQKRGVKMAFSKIHMEIATPLKTAP